MAVDTTATQQPAPQAPKERYMQNSILAKLKKVGRGEYETADGRYQIIKTLTGAGESTVEWDLMVRDGDEWEWDDRFPTKKAAHAWLLSTKYGA